MTIPLTDVDPTAAAAAWLDAFGAALARNDTTATESLFLPDGHWPDLVSFTWHILTMNRRAEIAAVLDHTLRAYARLVSGTRPTGWRHA